ncbi:MAG: NHL repeat-containing protein [Boseongicola sp.]|nr:NHL repeat-containing protein [Boseongicola sp.]
MFRLIFLLSLLAPPAAAQSFGPGPFASFDLASEPILGDPHDLSIGPDGRLYVADKLNARIAVLDPETLEFIEELGLSFLPAVRDVSFGPNGEVALAVSGASAVAIYEDLAALSAPPDIGVRAPGTEGALYHSSGRIFAMASGIGALVIFENLQAVNGVEGHLGAHDVAEAPDGSVWVADNRLRRLVRYSQNLERIQVIEADKFGFVGPRYMDITETGLLVVADQDAHRVLLIDPDGPDGGTLLGVLGDGKPGLGPDKFNNPEGIAVSGNRYFISDSDNNRIVRYSVFLN